MSNLFSKVIQGRQFNFQPIEFGSETGYHVDVKDEDGTRWEFSIMHAGENRLRYEAQKLPTWIDLSKRELETAIAEHE